MTLKYFLGLISITAMVTPFSVLHADSITGEEVTTRFSNADRVPEVYPIQGAGSLVGSGQEGYGILKDVVYWKGGVENTIFTHQNGDIQNQMVLSFQVNNTSSECPYVAVGWNLTNNNLISSVVDWKTGDNVAETGSGAWATYSLEKAWRLIIVYPENAPSETTAICAACGDDVATALSNAQAVNECQ